MDIDFLSSLLLELAIALIIALVISVGIEHQTRKRDLRSADNLRKLIATDVFKGVFANDLPRSYIDAVIDQNMMITLVRPYIRIYDRLSYSDDASNRAIKISRRLSYTIRNVARSKQDITIGCYMPVDLSSSLDQTRIVSASLRNKAISDSRLNSSRRVSGDLERIEYALPLEIEPGEDVSVNIEMLFFKEETDSEVWSTNYPNLKLSYSIRFDVPVSRFGVAERSATPLKEVFKDEPGGYGDWEVDGPMLINNSLTIWWDCR